MTAHLIRGAARQIPLKDKSVQLVVCSPPYFGLRQYSTNPVIWGGDPNCTHSLTAGSQFGNAWVEESPSSQRIRNGQGAHGLQDHGTDNRSPALDANVTLHPSRGATCTICGAWRGELGSEPHVAMFVAHLVEVFQEVKRVLRDDGCTFVNIGDSYCGSGKGPTGHNGIGNQGKRQGFTDRFSAGRPKSLQLVPERLAIALSDDGWVVRSRIAWIKAAPMPESVRDRPTSAWEHIFMLTKQAKYYWDADAVREDAKYGRVEYPNAIPQDGASSPGTQLWRNTGDLTRPVRRGTDQRDRTYHPDAGRNLWNYWGPISPDPYPLAHYATFPKRIPELCIRAATSEYGACAACGAAWARTTKQTPVVPPEQRKTPGGGYSTGAIHGVAREQSPGGQTERGALNQYLRTSTTTGWIPTCRCGPDAGVRPCVVLDPFSGSGTSAYVAASMGRIGIGVELSAEYIEQARYGRLRQDFLPLQAAQPAAERGGEGE